MFCIQCGTRNDDRALHCMQCGAKITMPGIASIPAPYSPAPPFYQPPLPEAQALIPNYMTQAVLVTLFCCTPIGLAAIWKAREVNKRLTANDYAGALIASNSAKTMLWVGFGLGIVLILIVFISNAN